MNKVAKGGTSVNSFVTVLLQRLLEFSRTYFFSLAVVVHKLIFGFLLPFLIPVFTGCIAVKAQNDFTAEGFKWQDLQRHSLLVAPLFDLREDSIAPPAHLDQLKFFPEDYLKAYPEKFKKAFTELRRDVRIFAAGGAHDYLMGLKDLANLAKPVVYRTKVPEELRQTIVNGTQGLRYILVSAITKEKLYHSIDYEFERYSADDSLTYQSTRSFKVVMAIWDSETGETMWVASKELSNQNSYTKSVYNPSKRKKVDEDGNTYWVGNPLRFSLTTELKRNYDRFPLFADRKGPFEGSLPGFALTLPISKEEEEYVSYRNWSYNRIGLGVGYTPIGEDDGTLSYIFDASSLIWHHYRIGIIAKRLVTTVEYQDYEYLYNFGGFGFSFDYRERVTSYWRLLLGASAGIGAYAAYRDPEQEDPPAPDDLDRIDETWPWIDLRLQNMFGDHAGFQGGIDLNYRVFGQPEKPFFKARQPSRFSLGLSIGYIWRGF